MCLAGVPRPVPARHDGGQPACAPALAVLSAGPAGVVGLRQPHTPAQHVRLKGITSVLGCRPLYVFKRTYRDYAGRPSASGFHKALSSRACL